MIDKSIYVIIFVYAASFSFLIIQYIIGDVFGIDMVVNGVNLQPNILALVNTGTINSITSDIVNANNTRNDTLSAIENAYNIGFNVGWDIVTILTGTYIFGVMVLLGVPVVAVAPMVFLYIILLARTIIALIRGL